MNAFSPTQIRYALFAPEPYQYNPNLLLSRELTASFAFNVPNY
jgi:hypothetical protein